jgi:hypothetical protein
MFKTDQRVLKEAVRRKEEAAKGTAETMAYHPLERSNKWIPVVI